MQRLGSVSFQSNSPADVFAVQDVWDYGIEMTDEMLFNIPEPQFDAEKTWVMGRVPKLKPVNIDGDTSIVQAVFKGENFSQSFYLTLYVECEMAEEIDKTPSTEELEKEKKERQIEVYL